MIIKALRWVVFVIAAFVLNFPVIATLLTSFKSSREIATNPGLWVNAPTLEHYAKVLTVSDRLNIFAYLWNSTLASLIGTTLAIVLAFPAAYSVSRSGYGRRYLMPLIVNLRALPLIIFAIPIYMMFQWVGLLDTQLGLGLILTIVNLPLALVILVNAINDITYELDEAALMDGASRLQVILTIVAPVCRPAIVTTLIFGFITAWNEFLFGLMLTTREAVPVTVGASFFFSSGGGGIQWGAASAVMIVAALPSAVLGLVMYRQISRSLTVGAVKG
jgi:multiple sugar transport system permease protein